MPKKILLIPSLVILTCLFYIVISHTTKTLPKPSATYEPAPNNTETPSKPDPVIAAAGDIACGAQHKNQPCKQKDTAQLLLNLKPTAVLTLGDNQYDSGEYENFLNFYDPSWGQLKTITYPVPGNHDYETPKAKGYFDYFRDRAGDRAKGYYSFDIGEWHLIALNSNCYAIGGCGKGSPQEVWLKEDLAAHTINKCTLAYWHHPLFSSGVEHGNDPQFLSFWQDLYEYGVDIVLNGHDHDYERFAPQDPTGKLDTKQGIREFVVGTGGRNLYTIKKTIPNSEVHDFKTYGVLKLILHSASYEWEFIPIASQTFTDSGKDSCH